MMNKSKGLALSQSKGFTIIELIVVIAIIAILAAIVMVNVTQYIGKSKDAAIQANLDTAKTAAAAYFADQAEGAGHYTSIDSTSTTAVNALNFQRALTAAGGATASVGDDAFCVSAALSKSGHIACLDASGLTTDGTASCGTGTHTCGGAAACSTAGGSCVLSSDCCTGAGLVCSAGTCL